MPRRVMLPYPSTSRRLCAAARCPRITTIALLSILLACLYNSRTLLSKDQPTLTRAVNPAAPRTVLEPAVEVVKEVTDKSDTGILGFGQKDIADEPHTVYNNRPAQVIDNEPLSDGERPTDLNPVSVTDLETNTGEKDLVGYISDAQKDQAEHPVSTDATTESASEALASVAKDQTTETEAETIPAVEKTDEETSNDAATTTLEGALTATLSDSAERTDETDRSTATDVIDGEVPATEKQEDVDGASTTEETVTSQSDLTGVDGEHVVENQESADDAQNAREGIQGVDSEVLIADKQESADGSTEVESAVDGEGATVVVKTAEKDVAEASETEGLETIDKQETEEGVAVEGASDTAERAEIDLATITESGNVDGQETVEDGLDAADKQDAVESAETDATDMTSDSAKQAENDEETVSSNEITAVEKQELESDTAVLESEKERVVADDADKVEEADGAMVADLSVSDKMKDEQSTEEGEGIDTTVSGGDDIDAGDKQERLSETEEVTQEDKQPSEIAIEGELDTAEKQEGEEATPMQEAAGDLDLSHEEKQEADVKVDEDRPENADDETTEVLKERRR